MDLWCIDVYIIYCALYLCLLWFDLLQVKRFQVLVALLLSSQTKDEVTAGAFERLRLRGLAVPGALRDFEEAQLAELLKPVGFYRMKAGYLKKISLIVGSEYEDDIPADLESLMKLPGIGPKMAYLTMQCAWNESLGIGVDVHVHRISERLGWTFGCKTPEDTRKVEV
jgi:endonuclease III